MLYCVSYCYAIEFRQSRCTCLSSQYSSGLVRLRWIWMMLVQHQQRSSSSRIPTRTSSRPSSLIRSRSRVAERNSRRQSRGPHGHALWQMVINSVLFFLLSGSTEHVRVVGGRIHRSMGATSTTHVSSAYGAVWCFRESDQYDRICWRLQYGLDLGVHVVLHIASAFG